MSKQQLYSILKWALIVVVALFMFFYVMPCFVKYLYGCIYETPESIDVSKTGQLGDSYGIYNALFSGLAFAAVVVTLMYQIRDTRKRTLANLYYQMLDTQQKVIEDITVSQVRYAKDSAKVEKFKGRKAFVEYKIQISKLLAAIKEVNEAEHFNLSKNDIADIAYAVFFYGSAPTWKPFMMEMLRDYQDKERLVDAIISKLSAEKRYVLTRPNQNYLSVYFRNMYNAIKLIDQSKFLNDKEKSEYIKILRAQLSNAELYVLFFNVISRFGRKWIDGNLVEKYQLVQNIPAKYCDGYEPKDYFPRIKFESDETTKSTFVDMQMPRGQ